MERGRSLKNAGGISAEIDIFEQQMELRKQGKIDEKVFAETRSAARHLRAALR